MSDENKDATEYEIGTTETADVVSDESAADAQSKPKKKKKGPIILIAVLAFLVVLGGGGAIVYATQHANPAFCNFICHTPMDPYVASWQDGTSINEAQADSGALLAITAHKDSDQAVVCLDCHIDGIDTQIQEGIAWVSGNYTVPLEGFTLTSKDEVKDGQKQGAEFCLTDGCHEGISSIEELTASSADQNRNYHDPNGHNGLLECSSCHQTHQQSVLYCSLCHADMEVPEGWLTQKEYDAQVEAAKKAAAA